MRWTTLNIYLALWAGTVALMAVYLGAIYVVWHFAAKWW